MVVGAVEYLGVAVGSGWWSACGGGIRGGWSSRGRDMVGCDGMKRVG